jgi:hypothetical protein
MSRARLPLVILTAMALSVTASGPTLSAEPSPFETYLALLNSRLDAAISSAGRVGIGAGVTDNFEVVGHNDLGGNLAADVWAHGDFAYVGDILCERVGVRVVDFSDPANPAVVSVLRDPVSTTSEDVVVRSIATPYFTGDLAVVGIQGCNERAFTGLQFFDVTDPTLPFQVGRWAAPVGSIGCHEVDLIQRADGLVLAGCANIFAELIFEGQEDVEDEVVLVDATNPYSPAKVGGWALFDHFGMEPREAGVGCFRGTFNHSVRFFDGGDTVYASYWDQGTVNLDISNPASPLYVRKTKIAPPDEDGDQHSMTLGGPGESILLINPEDFSPVDGCPELNGWGEVYIYDNLSPDVSGTKGLLGTFSTPNSRSDRTDGFYTVHNTEVTLESQAFSSWYSDGIVWWDMTDPSAPVQRGQFVPEIDPLMWGVFIDSAHDLILGSDIISGLWIVRPVGLGDF